MLFNLTIKAKYFNDKLLCVTVINTRRTLVFIFCECVYELTNALFTHIHCVAGFLFFFLRSLLSLHRSLLFYDKRHLRGYRPIQGHNWKIAFVICFDASRYVRVTAITKRTEARFFPIVLKYLYLSFILKFLFKITIYNH